MARVRNNKSKDDVTPEQTETVAPEEAQTTDLAETAEIVEEPADEAEADEAVVLEEPALTEVDETPRSETAPRTEPVAQPAPIVRKSGFFPMVLGGVVAAGIGAGAAGYVVPRIWTPSSSTEAMAGLKEDMAAQAATLSRVDSDLGKLKADSTASDTAAAQAALSESIAAEIEGLRTSLSALDTRLADQAKKIGAFDDRLSEIEKRPVEGGAASATALEAFGREMADLRAEIDAQRNAMAEAQQAIAATATAATDKISAAEAEASKMRDEAEELARQGTARAALSRIQAAIESGGALEAALGDLAGAGVTVPSALSDQAQGVPSINALRTAFPTAAREALALSLKATAGESLWERTTAFLRSQSGARSLSPRAGEDPDAVLSRAEAALKAGDLDGTIAEIGQLPAEGQARMAEWVELAKRRVAATEAVAALAKEIQ